MMLSGHQNDIHGKNNKIKILVILIQMLNCYPIGYCGNKYRETKKYLDDILEGINLNEIDIIVEPFGGIFGFSRVIHEKTDYKGQYWINDIEKDLIKTHKRIKSDWNGLRTELEEKLSKYKTDAELTDTLKKNSDYVMEKMCSFRGRLKKISKGHDKIRVFEKRKSNYKPFFKKVKFFNKTHSEFIDNLPKGKRILIFFDPPYFNSSNAEYNHYCKNGKDNDQTIFYLDILNYFKNPNYKSIMIMNKIALINYLFKDYMRKEYDNTYQIYKHKVKHIIYKNY